MGLLDKVKGLASGHKSEVADGIDKTAEAVKDKVGHDDEVDKAAAVVKDQLGIDDK